MIIMVLFSIYFGWWLSVNEWKKGCIKERKKERKKDLFK